MTKLEELEKEFKSHMEGWREDYRLREHENLLGLIVNDAWFRFYHMLSQHNTDLESKIKAMERKHWKWCAILTRQYEKENCNCGAKYYNQAVKDLISLLKE
jgi:hypothetical protein